jgi:signal transduction histidine kinase
VTLCLDVAKELDFLIKSRGQKIVFNTSDSEIIVKNNRKALNTVIYNLLTNASQYGLKGSIKLEIKKDRKGALISVSDNGIGIPKKEQKNIFKKFFRTNKAKEVYDNGSGLGLYLVKGLVDRIGGNIRFESEKGKGTTFYVSIK